MSEQFPTSSSLTTYLTFDGNCKEAIDFYKSVLGGEIKMISTFAEMPPNEDFTVPEENKDHIMHTTYVFDGCTIQASDRGGGHYPFNPGNNFHLSVYFPDKDRAKQVFDQLSVGGNTTMPFNEVFWGGSFGSFIDKFGIPWMVSCP